MFDKYLHTHTNGIYLNCLFIKRNKTFIFSCLCVSQKIRSLFITIVLPHRYVRTVTTPGVSHRCAGSALRASAFVSKAH
jgi:hypothetical protein